MLLAIPTLLIVISAAFLLVHLAPGDATTFLAGDGAIGDEYLAAIRAEYGLDDPFHIQYIKYITKVITGDLGTSFRYSAPVTELILERLPATLVLMLGAIILFEGGETGEGSYMFPDQPGSSNVGYRV